jgi:hypothetical protein
LKPGRGRFEHSRDHHRAHTGREPDGDGTALIPRDDVVRLHDALRNEAMHRRVGQWQTACLTNRASEVRFLPRRLWPRSEVVETPGRGPGGSRFESGRSPHRRNAAVSFRDLALRGIWRSARSHTPCRRVRFPPSRPSHAPQLGPLAAARLPCKEKGAGSNPARSTDSRTQHTC